MLDTFKAQLKAKAKTLGVTNLSNKRIDAFAATLEKHNPNLSTDDDHSEVVDRFLELTDIKAIAAYDDRSRTAARKETPQGKENDTDDAQASNDGDQAQQPPADAMPSWFKPFAEKLTRFEQKEKQQTMEQQIADKLKNVPREYWSMMALPQKEEDIEDFTTRVEQNWVKLGLSSSTKPAVAGGSTSTGKVDPDLVNFSKKQNEQVTKKP